MRIMKSFGRTRTLWHIAVTKLKINVEIDVTEEATQRSDAFTTTWKRYAKCPPGFTENLLMKCLQLIQYVYQCIVTHCWILQNTQQTPVDVFRTNRLSTHKAHQIASTTDSTSAITSHYTHIPSHHITPHHYITSHATHMKIDSSVSERPGLLLVGSSAVALAQSRVVCDKFLVMSISAITFSLLWPKFLNQTDPGHLHGCWCISLTTARNLNGSNPDDSLVQDSSNSAVSSGEDHTNSLVDGLRWLKNTTVSFHRCFMDWPQIGTWPFTKKILVQSAMFLTTFSKWSSMSDDGPNVVTEYLLYMCTLFCWLIPIAIEAGKHHFGDE